MDNDTTLQFIEDYRSFVCLWDIHSRSYTNKYQRHDAYTSLAQKYGITEKAVRNKIKSLRSYFSKEHQKVTQRRSGAGAEENVRSTWFAYQAMGFVLDSVKPRATRDSVPAVENAFAGPSRQDLNTFQDEYEDQDDMGEFPAQNPGNCRDDLEEQTGHPDSPPQHALPAATKQNRKRKRDQCEQREAEAFDFLKKAATAISEKDDSAIFSQMVCAELRKLNHYNRAVAKQKIQNIIFDLQIEQMSKETRNQDIIVQPSQSILVVHENPNSTGTETEMDTGVGLMDFFVNEETVA